MATLGSLTLILEAQTASFNKQMADVNKQLDALKKQSAETSSALAGFGKAIGGYFSADAILKGVEALHKWVAATNEVVDAQGKLADELGTSRDFIEQMAGVFHEIEIPAEQGAAALEKFARNVGKAEQGNEAAQESFAALGISMQQLKGNTLEQNFLKAADAISRLQNQAQKLDLAQELFGKGSFQMVRLFDQGEAGIKKMMDAIKPLTDEQRDAFEKYDDAMKHMEAAWGRLSKTLGADVVPSFTLIATLLETILKLSEKITGSWAAGTWATMMNTATDQLDRFNKGEIGVGGLLSGGKGDMSDFGYFIKMLEPQLGKLGILGDALKAVGGAIRGAEGGKAGAEGKAGEHKGGVEGDKVDAEKNREAFKANTEALKEAKNANKELKDKISEYTFKLANIAKPNVNQLWEGQKLLEKGAEPQLVAALNRLVAATEAETLKKSIIDSSAEGAFIKRIAEIMRAFGPNALGGGQRRVDPDAARAVRDASRNLVHALGGISRPAEVFQDRIANLNDAFRRLTAAGFGDTARKMYPRIVSDIYSDYKTPNKAAPAMELGSQEAASTIAQFQLGNVATDPQRQIAENTKGAVAELRQLNVAMAKQVAANMQPLGR